MSAVLITRIASDNNAVAVKCPFALWTTNESHCKMNSETRKAQFRFTLVLMVSLIKFPFCSSAPLSTHYLQRLLPKTGLGAAGLIKLRPQVFSLLFYMTTACWCPWNGKCLRMGFQSEIWLEAPFQLCKLAEGSARGRGEVKNEDDKQQHWITELCLCLWF